MTHEILSIYKIFISYHIFNIVLNHHEVATLNHPLKDDHGHVHGHVLITRF